jgi:hypothetical protein
MQVCEGCGRVHILIRGDERAQGDERASGGSGCGGRGRVVVAVVGLK